MTKVERGRKPTKVFPLYQSPEGKKENRKGEKKVKTSLCRCGGGRWGQYSSRIKTGRGARRERGGVKNLSCKASLHICPLNRGEAVLGLKKKIRDPRVSCEGGMEPIGGLYYWWGWTFNRPLMRLKVEGGLSGSVGEGGL